MFPWGRGGGVLRRLRCQIGDIGLVVECDRPGDACRLAGQRDDRDIDVLALGQLPDPVTEVVLPAFAPSQCSATPMNQQGAQVTVAALADAQQAVTPPGTVLSRCQPQRGGKIAATFEGLSIAQGTGQCTGGQYADAA